MVNFAELKAKAEKAKDASVTKMTNTRDRYTSVPGSKVKWDPNWKRAPPPAPASTSGPPPPPAGSRPEVIVSDVSAPPAVPRASRPTDLVDLPVQPSYTLLPPPTRAASGYPTHHHETSSVGVDKIDWANLSAEDKAVFFEWLDEFFSRYLGVEVGPGPGARRGASAIVSATQPMLAIRRMQGKGPPPTVNMATRPPA